MNIAFESGILRRSDTHLEYLTKKDEFLNALTSDAEYQAFKKIYLDGNNTLTKMEKAGFKIDDESFSEKEKDFRKETFFLELFSKKISFQEVRNYLKFLNEEGEYITMHKTKGSSIENVLVVLEEFFWNEYKFGTIFKNNPEDDDTKLKNLKLTYVACSRARTKLHCARVISPEEESQLKLYFPNAIKV